MGFCTQRARRKSYGNTYYRCDIFYSFQNREAEQALTGTEGFGRKSAGEKDTDAE